MINLANVKSRIYPGQAMKPFSHYQPEPAKAYHAVTSRTDGRWHTRVNTPGTHATATHERLGDAEDWARNLGATTFEVTDHAKLDKFFAKAGYEAGLKLGREKLLLVANANHIDNFALWIAKTIDDGIIGAVLTNNDDYCDWVNRYCRNPNAKHACYRKDHSPSNNAFVIPIAHRIYREFRQP